MLPNLSGLRLIHDAAADTAGKLSPEEKAVMNVEWKQLHPGVEWGGLKQGQDALWQEASTLKKQIMDRVRNRARQSADRAAAQEKARAAAEEKEEKARAAAQERTHEAALALQGDPMIRILFMALEEQGNVDCAMLQKLMKDAAGKDELEAAALEVATMFRPKLTLQQSEAASPFPWTARLLRYCKQPGLEPTARGRFFSLTGLKNGLRMWVNDKPAALAKHGPIEDWDVSLVDSFNDLFDLNPTRMPSRADRTLFLYTNFARIPRPQTRPRPEKDFNEDLSKWNVSKVTTMKDAFFYAESFNGDLSKWNVSNVTNMNGMFSDSAAFQGRGLEMWNVSNVTNMAYMFAGASAFDRNLKHWDVRKVTNMRGMFIKATSFTGRGLDNWDVSNVHMIDSMFKDAVEFAGDLSAWDLNNVIGIHAKDKVPGRPSFYKNERRIYDMFEGDMRNTERRDRNILHLKKNLKH